MRRIDGQVISYEPGVVIEDWQDSHWKTGRVQGEVKCFMESGTLFRAWNEAVLGMWKVDATWMTWIGVVVVNVGGGGYELQLYAKG